MPKLLLYVKDGRTTSQRVDRVRMPKRMETTLDPPNAEFVTQQLEITKDAREGQHCPASRREDQRKTLSAANP
jgi:hypothetical protein